MKTIEVVFDGRAFVPSEPVDLPSGTRLRLTVPENRDEASSRLVPNQPRPLTEEEEKHWEELCRIWETASWPFSSVDEALAYSRGRPWPELLLLPDLPIPTENRKEGSN
jgi:hypothetical protein